MRSLFPLFFLVVFPLTSHAANELSVDINCDKAKHFDDCVTRNHEKALNRIVALNDLMLGAVGEVIKPKFQRIVDAWDKSIEADCAVENEGFDKTNCEYIAATSRAYVLAHIIARHSRVESVDEVLGIAEQRLMTSEAPDNGVAATKVPVRYNGKAPSKDSDFKLIEAQLDMREMTDVLSRCPADREAEPEKQQACMTKAALVVSGWIHRAGFSVDAMMVKAHNNGNGSPYWAFLNSKMGDTLVAITTALGYQGGRDALVNNGYLKTETAEMFAAHVNKGK